MVIFFVFVGLVCEYEIVFYWNYIVLWNYFDYFGVVFFIFIKVFKKGVEDYVFEDVIFLSE